MKINHNIFVSIRVILYIASVVLATNERHINLQGVEASTSKPEGFLMKVDMERTCKKCGETKPIEEFVKAKRNKNGREYTCKKCKYILSGAIWAKNNREKVNKNYTKRKEYYLRNANEYRFVNKAKLMITDKIRRTRYCKNLDLPYILSLLSRQSGIDRRILKQHPELIEITRKKIYYKRQLKNNENEKTSESS